MRNSDVSGNCEESNKQKYLKKDGVKYYSVNGGTCKDCELSPCPVFDKGCKLEKGDVWKLSPGYGSARNCELFNKAKDLQNKGALFDTIKKNTYKTNRDFEKPLDIKEVDAMLKTFKHKQYQEFGNNLYLHKNGKIGRVTGVYANDGALFIFEELDEDSGDTGDNIFYTEMRQLKPCDRQTYDKSFPPEEGCVAWEEQFYKHILIDKGLPTEQQVYVGKCPHCGGYGEAGERFTGPYHKIITTGIQNKVKCLKCGAEGPERVCLLESIEAYNERHGEKRII